jgi:hypothetical protein
MARLYRSAGIPFCASISSMIVIVGSEDRSFVNKSKFKLFETVEEIVSYCAYMFLKISGGRLPEHLHNMMVLDCSGNTYLRLYLKRTHGKA